MNFSVPKTILAWLIWTGVSPASADWRDEIGLTRLQLIAGSELPTAPSQGLTQVEANDSLANFEPNTASPLFAGKTFTHKSDTSATSGSSSHATTVASFFYGSSSQIPGACGVNLYGANGWLTSNFLNAGTTSAPLVESSAVQNHSWIGVLGGTFTAIQATDICRRLDFAIHRDGFVSVVGVNNGSSTTLPAILCQSYNTISVGLANGSHSAGLTTFDGTNRRKPDIVAPESVTSWATPMVAGSAGLLYAKLRTSYSISGANLPRVVKALLLAAATKDTVPGWDNSPTSPLDTVYGAGKLNVCLAYTALRSGKATAGTTTQHKLRGWAAEAVASTAKTYYFKIPAGAPSTPFSAALTWHRTVGGAWDNSTSTLRNLSLRLYQASGFTLGSQIAASTSAVDNVELIYQSALPPGDYALRVENASSTSTSTNYALAWHSLPAVTVSATVATAKEIDGQAGLVTFNRTGDTTLPLLVPLSVSGSAIAGTHYQALPTSVTFPAGQSSTTLQVIPLADSLAQGNRSVIVAAAADFASVRDATQPAALTIEDKPADAWRSIHFTAVELINPAISGDTADPDGDRLANLMEYALGLAPKSPSVSPVSTLDVNGYLALSVAKNPAAADIIWAAQVSGEASSWQPATPISGTQDPIFAARDGVPKSSADRRFIRLQVTRP